METVGLAFSQEEVVFLLGLLRSDFIPGLGQPPMGDMNQEEIGVAMAGAERGLIARGLLDVLPDATAQVEELALVLVGTCAYPKYSLLISMERHDTKELHNFHFGEKHISIEHTVPQNGVHLFTAYKNEDECLKRAIEVLNLTDQPAPQGNPTTLSQNTLAIATDLATMDNVGQAQQMLVNEGLALPTAALLAAALGHLIGQVDIVAIKHDNVEKVKFASDTLLLGEDGYWLVEKPSAGQSDRRTIRPITALALHELLREELALPGKRPVG